MSTELTRLEQFVLQRMALGDTYKQVAHQLGMNVKTTESVGFRAVRKLGARNITHAAVIALDRGLIHPEECGTERTYRWHIRHGEATDTLCRGALAATRREQRNGGTQ